MDAHPLFSINVAQLDHEYTQISTTEGARRCSLLAEYGHRWPESRKGDLEYHTSQGRVRLCQQSSRFGQSESPSCPRWSIAG